MIHSVLLGHNLLYLILLSLVSNLSCNSWHFCCHLMSQKHQLVVKSPELQKDSWEHFVLKCLMVTVTGVINIVVVSSQRNKALHFNCQILLSSGNPVPQWMAVHGIFVLPGVIAWLCLDTVSNRMGVVGHLLLPAQLPGTHWAMICIIWRLALTVSDVCLKLGSFQGTSTSSASEISHFIIRDLLTVKPDDRRLCQKCFVVVSGRPVSCVNWIVLLPSSSRRKPRHLVSQWNRVHAQVLAVRDTHALPSIDSVRVVAQIRFRSTTLSFGFISWPY